MSQVNTRHIKANGIRMSYAFHGSEGKPVVMLSHSLAANMGMWAPQVAALKEQYRILTYDTRGHGDTEVTEPPYSLNLLAEDVVALLAELDISKVHFIGLSMGGMIGQVLGIRFPHVVASLVLCDCNSRVPDDMKYVFDDRIRMALEQGMAAAVEPTIARWFTAPFIESHPEVVDPIREMIRTGPAKGYAGCCYALRELNLTSQLHKIATPTLLIVGEQDTRAPISAHEEIQHEISGSKLLVLKPAAHLASAEQPESYNEAVLRFLSEVI